MTPGRWLRVKDLFASSLQKSAVERTAFLEKACAGDRELLADVERLLAAHEKPGAFLDGASHLRDETVAGHRVGPYRLVRQIGRGGMGQVYLAERADGAYRKQVAIKVVADDAASDDLVPRFRNERQILAALVHPNIATLLDGGTTDEGLPYFVMEYVEGEPIDEYCERRALPVRERLELFLAVCGAVACAHANQVVHRDLKPGNILVKKDGTPKLLDFGLGKLLASDTGERTASQLRFATPAFASPEQLRGDPVTAATDIYSLGVLLSVLVEPHARGLHAIVAKATAHDPADRYSSVGELSEEIRRYLDGGSASSGAAAFFSELKRRRVVRALVGYGIAGFAVLQIIEPVMHGLHWPDVVLSYVVGGLAVGFPLVVGLAWIFDLNAGRIERTPRSPKLRRGPVVLALAAIGVLVAAPGVIWHFVLRGPVAPAAVAARPASIAVLPFVNLSADKDDDYFSDGITEELINALANIEGIRVVARTSAFSFKGKNENVREIGEKLNVATVLEGSVRRDGNMLRITAQLINATDGYHLWSKTYDRELKGVFSLEDELTRAIVQSLRPQLVHEPAQLVQQSTVNTEAHDLYLRGRYVLNNRSRTKDMLTSACAMFEQAIAIDGGYALAHAGLAECAALAANYRTAPPAQMLAKAKQHALLAMKLDDSLAEAHAALAFVLSTAQFDWEAAAREYRRAIALRPGYSTAHFRFGIDLLDMGRLAEGLEEAQKAMSLDPTSSIIGNAVATAYYLGRDYHRAIEYGMRALELDPAAWNVRQFLAASYWKAGRRSEALRTLDGAPVAVADLEATRAWILADGGDLAAARRILAGFEKRWAEAPHSPAILGGALIAVGEADRGFALLGEAIDERDGAVYGLKVNPAWDRVRSDPRYHALLQRMNLE